MSEAAIAAARKKVQAARRCLVISHIRPDGDAAGSLLGLGLALQAAGKETQMALADGLPATFRHLGGSEQVVKQPAGSFDLICTVDCSDLSRVGDALEDYGAPDLNIDHHVTNLGFAGINLVDPEATATSEMLVELLPALGLPMPIDAAAALLTGLITDTLGFRTSNMTPKALRVAAGLVEMGLDLPELYRLALMGVSFEAARYWGSGLSHLEREGRLVWATLTLADRKAVDYPGRDDADLINFISSIEGADIAVVFTEQGNKRVKVSWRARPGIDVSQLALSFGGGGHPAASGADIPGKLDEVRPKVLAATQELLSSAERAAHSAH